MARQRKILPARRTDAIDNSLLIRSAESLGRMIGSLQRQLDAARHLTVGAVGIESRGNGQALANRRTAGSAGKAKTKSKAAAPKKSATVRKAAAGRSRPRAQRRTSTAGRDTRT